MQLTWRERKFTVHIWMKTGWEISLFCGGVSEDGQWERATLRWVNTVQSVKERTKGLREEHYGTAGAAGINCNKSISDGDNGIFKKMCSQRCDESVYGYAFKRQQEKWWGIFSIRCILSFKIQYYFRIIFYWLLWSLRYMSCIKTWNHDRKIILILTYYRCCMELFTIKKVLVSSKSLEFS